MDSADEDAAGTSQLPACDPSQPRQRDASEHWLQDEHRECAQDNNPRYLACVLEDGTTKPCGAARGGRMCS